MKMEKKTLSFIDYQKILSKDCIFYAHTNHEQKETLQEHIIRCEKYFVKLYESKNIELIVQRFYQNMHFQNENASFDFLKELLVQLVSFHDFGKINPRFQRVKMNHNIGKDYSGLIKHHHSFLSALIYLDYFLNQLDIHEEICNENKKILEKMIVEHAYIIAHHHSDLNSLSEFLSLFNTSQIQKLIKDLITNPIKGYKGLFYVDERKIKLLVCHFPKNVQQYSSNEYALKYFYYRLAYSLLVTSDYYATSEFMNKKEFNVVGDTLSIKDFQKAYNQNDLVKNIRIYEKEKYQGIHKNFDKITEINDLRNELFLDAERNLQSYLDEQIYFLEAPTGSGKSNIAFNLSFQLMQNRKKLFYIYPFNTLVEQNKNNLSHLFPQQNYQEQIVVVNSLTPLPRKDDEDSQEYYQKLLLDRQFLNYPMILSTHVSFFNLLFGSKKEDVIGFHQLSESVIVLDEIQSYKNQIWAEIIIMLQACAKLMDMKIIIMSATLPNLEELSGQRHIIKHLLPCPQLYYEHHLFKDRVKIHYELLEEKIDLEKLKNHVVQRQGLNKKILVEFITKGSAYQFFKMLKDSDEIYVDVKCLTGDDSMIDREKILSPIKNNEIQSIILVSTQVIEAGIDIDMDIGYKDISLLDSEEQFLGRINRSCLRMGDVYFFDYDQCKMIYRGDIRTNNKLILKNNEMQLVLSNKNFSYYYHKVMEILKRDRNQSTDETGLHYFFELVNKLDFARISERMKLIDDNSWLVDVVLCRKIELENGTVLDGWVIWNRYKDLLQNNEIDYSEKQVKLIEIRSQLNYFVYRMKRNVDLQYNDILGELRCIEDAREFFVDGRLDRDKFGQFSYDFL